jgi:uncharacterized protein
MIRAQAESLHEVAHRPWPLNPSRWLMAQTWQRLLFAHWRLPYDVLRPHVPKRLTLEQFDGSAWIGITPFRVTGLRLRGLPPVPPLSSFDELNCRTYVRYEDRPGIWFFSLDASSALAVAAARLSYRLPYRRASIRVRDRSFTASVANGRFSARYDGVGSAAAATAGTLEHFLVERYCLYADDGKMRADIHHRPWPLQAADALVELEGLAPVQLDGEPICHYAERLDVVIWPPERL